MSVGPSSGSVSQTGTSKGDFFASQSKAIGGPSRSHRFKRSPNKSGSNRYVMFCYRCGQDGHHLNDCKEQKNPELVQQKLEGRFQGQLNK